MDSNMMSTYVKRYRIYRKSHGIVGSWILANDPLWFMIIYPGIIGTIAAIFIWS